MPPAIPPVIPNVRPSPGGRWRSGISLLVLASYVLIIGLSGLERDVGQSPALGSGSRHLLLACGIGLASFGAIFFLAWILSRPNWEQLYLSWRPGKWVVPLAVVYSIGLRLFVGILMAMIFGVLLALGVISQENLTTFVTANRPNVEALIDVKALKSDPVYFWLTLTLVSFVVAGLREELWRAGCLAALARLWPGGFGSRLGQFAAVFLVSVVFGLGHAAQGWLAVGLTSLVGVGLGAVMVFHRSIWPAVIAHGLFNATSFALLPWAAEMLKQVR